MNNTILGTMNIEYSCTSNINNSIEYYKDILEKYVSQTEYPIIDTAYYYGNTKTEKILGNILPQLFRTPLISTKANPWFENDFTNGILGQLSDTALTRQLNTSLQNLQKEKVEIFYLHCPDYETPIKDTLETCDKLWRNEKFNYLGISNYSNIQLEEILSVCEKNGFNSPRYYQGMYNIICRKVEEIFPLLDEYNINFWAYNPLAGGLLTGKYKNGIPNSNSRFSSNTIYQNIFWKSEIIEPLQEYFHSPLCLEHSLNWLYNYSKIRQNQDKIIIGVSTLEQLDKNVEIISNKTQHDKETIEYLNELYYKIQNASPNYYY
jgi:aflatoxin B1 aldehyde reductase